MITSYMAAASKRWRRTVGTGPAVDWPGGTALQTDASLEQTVGQTAGAIGYIDRPSRLGAGVRAAQLLNPKRAYVAPTVPATSAVGKAARPGDGLSLETINAPVADAYPVASETYVLIYRDLCVAGMVPRQAAAIQRFVTFLVGAGQSTVRQLSFAPLPPRLRDSAQAAVRKLSCNSQSI
jgi:phosphate transport system substrate-binding protein